MDFAPYIVRCTQCKTIRYETPAETNQRKLSSLLWYLPCLSPNPGYPSICNCRETPFVISTRLVGTASHLYICDLLFRGVCEVNNYTGGTRDGFWYVGGVAAGANNQYKLEISNPPQVYWLNANDVQIDGYCFLINFSKRVVIAAGATVTMTGDATDAGQYINQDVDLNPITVPDDLPDNPIRVTQPFDGQFLQMDCTFIYDYTSGGAILTEDGNRIVQETGGAILTE